ncbi:MAG: GTP cyclohydrolase FolE2 [Luteibacter sp.]|uniref:GTP cyclohydrolase FolE2 n=1 Tax=unclassified Luteibacter TaxID=2620188 RepID=UPI0009A6FA7B|nr:MULTISPECIES: GTP cyclohydrolase FolE2 [unclassified Luteibacter]MDQ7995955.1 GTP cyclohydrolase FolE2 [Luteibacter sp.]MDQ8051153.1 GTP cyclohydrolase FolE2 [Luteibacter sp.]MDR6644039.1 GTP cyclohydrolase I [Luteibacter sp. 1214]SKC03344.1 GTP cyclohydrolase I [Luteibacter sp. 22Crub2.1]
MYIHDSPTRLLPDVASQEHALALGTLDWVGMDGMEMPVAFDAGDGDVRSTGARVGAFVNLTKAEARGIHMSRLYLLVSEALSAGPLTIDGIRRLLNDFLSSHEGLSDHARITIGFDHLVRRHALRSDNSGWRSYPITIDATLTGETFRLEIVTDVVYSSTCPASAALSRQLIQDNFASTFAAGQPLDRETILAWLGTEKGIVATPHAQRSTATIRVRPAGDGVFPLITLIDNVEAALGTPVQTAVKRADEQAFALANGQNLMFCEDAARRIQKTLEADRNVADFHVRVAHHESLHPHDAVAFASKAR